MTAAKPAPKQKPKDDRAKARRVVGRVICNGQWLYLGTQPDPIGLIVEALVDANLIRGEEP